MVHETPKGTESDKRPAGPEELFGPWTQMGIDNSEISRMNKRLCHCPGHQRRSRERDVSLLRPAASRCRGGGVSRRRKDCPPLEGFSEKAVRPTMANPLPRPAARTQVQGTGHLVSPAHHITVSRWWSFRRCKDSLPASGSTQEKYLGPFGIAWGPIEPRIRPAPSGMREVDRTIDLLNVLNCRLKCSRAPLAIRMPWL